MEPAIQRILLGPAEQKDGEGPRSGPTNSAPRVCAGLLGLFFKSVSPLMFVILVSPGWFPHQDQQ